jgi:hypothetical protein
MMRRGIMDVVPDEINDPVDTGQGTQHPGSADGQTSPTAGESPADGWNTQDRI